MTGFDMKGIALFATVGMGVLFLAAVCALPATAALLAWLLQPRVSWLPDPAAVWWYGLAAEGALAVLLAVAIAVARRREDGRQERGR